MAPSLLLILAALSAPPTYVFLSADAVRSAEGVRIEPQLPKAGLTLIAKNPDRPKLWYAPVAARGNGSSVSIWYQRVDNDEAEYSDRRTLCLGELQNGTWTLPALHAEPPVWGGPNNVCMRRSPHKPTWGGFNVFQLVEFEGALRLLYWDQPDETGQAGAMLARSVDGGRTWTKEHGTVFTEHNDAFTLLKQGDTFLLYQTALEDWPDKPYPDNLDKKRRVQSLRVSPDLRTWSAQEVFLRPDESDAPETEFYLLKVFAYGQGYAGLLMKYYGDPNLPGKHSAILKYELIVSPDARTWSRPFRDADLGFWSYADPFRHGGAMHFVIWKDGGMETVAFRPDGLTALVADATAEFTTLPVVIAKTGLTLNADTRDGWIEVSQLDLAGNPLDHYAPIRIAGEDGVAIPSKWQVYELHTMRGRPVILKFRMHHARLYALGGCSLYRGNP